MSARPDFVALLYPVITMRPPLAHADSVRNLLGAAPSAALLDRLSLERRARSDMPPVFLVHTTEDRSVRTSASGFEYPPATADVWAGTRSLL